MPIEHPQTFKRRYHISKSKRAKQFPPLISIIVPCYNIKLSLMIKCSLLRKPLGVIKQKHCQIPFILFTLDL